MAVAVGEQPIPDNQITRLGRNRLDVEANGKTAEVGRARIAVERLRLYSLLQVAMKAGDALNAAHVCRGVGQA